MPDCQYQESISAAYPIGWQDQSHRRNLDRAYEVFGSGWQGYPFCREDARGFVRENIGVCEGFLLSKK